MQIIVYFIIKHHEGDKRNECAALVTSARLLLETGYETLEQLLAIKTINPDDEDARITRQKVSGALNSLAAACRFADNVHGVYAFNAESLLVQHGGSIDINDFNTSFESGLLALESTDTHTTDTKATSILLALERAIKQLIDEYIKQLTDKEVRKAFAPYKVM